MSSKPDVVNTEEENIFLDDILVKFDMTGRFYLIVWPFLFLAYVSNSVSMFNYVFTAEATGFRCEDKRFGNNTCTSLNDSDLVCKEWIYDEPDTFLAEFELACDEWKTTVVGTAHNFGYMIGLLVVGPLSDRLGRLTTLAVTGLLGGVLGIARSFSTWYWAFIALEFLEAAIGDIGSPLYMLTIEMVSTEKRVLFQLVCGIGYSFGFLVLPLAAWLTPNWRYLLRVIYTPALLILIYACILDESPRWLLSKGRKEEAVVIIQRMAKSNKVKLDEANLDKLSYVDNKEIPYLELLMDTLSSSILSKRFLICACWWIVSCFVNYGLQINSVALHGNKYVDFSLIAIVEAAGHISVYFLLKRYGRKMPLVYAFFLAALLCLPQPFIPDYLNWLGITFYICGKMMSTVFYYITYMYTSELFPTYTRNSMHALCSSIGRIGAMVAPQTPLLTVYWQGLPSLVFGGASLIAGLVTLFAPDTSEVPLPDTVEEAQVLDVHHRKNTAKNKPSTHVYSNDVCCSNYTDSAF